VSRSFRPAAELLLMDHSAQPLLDRLPDVKKLLDQNVENLKGYVGEERVNIIKDCESFPSS